MRKSSNVKSIHVNEENSNEAPAVAFDLKDIPHTISFREMLCTH
jgi:hypothetical protein